MAFEENPWQRTESECDKGRPKEKREKSKRNDRLFSVEMVLRRRWQSIIINTFARMSFRAQFIIVQKLCTKVATTTPYASMPPSPFVSTHFTFCRFHYVRIASYTHSHRDKRVAGDIQWQRRCVAALHLSLVQQP